MGASIVIKERIRKHPVRVLAHRMRIACCRHGQKVPCDLAPQREPTHDVDGNMTDDQINQGLGAGTPDRISPPHTNPWGDLNKFNLSNLNKWARHGLADYWQHWFGTGFDHWTHPPNPGRDGNGNPCPNNDGSASPPNTSGSGCCND